MWKALGCPTVRRKLLLLGRPTTWQKLLSLAVHNNNLSIVLPCMLSIAVSTLLCYWNTTNHSLWSHGQWAYRWARQPHSGCHCTATGQSCVCVCVSLLYSGWHGDQRSPRRCADNRAYATSTGDKDPNTHQAHTGYIGSTDNKSLQCAQWVWAGYILNVPCHGTPICPGWNRLDTFGMYPNVRAELGGHLKYSRRWSGVRAGVLLGAQGAVRRGIEEGCESKREQGRGRSHSGPMSCLMRTEGVS